jgi:hypothetical protein
MNRFPMWTRIFFSLAFLLLALRIVTRILGWGDNVSIISGMIPASSGRVIMGMAAIIIHFAFVITAPIFFGAGVLGVLANARCRER